MAQFVKLPTPSSISYLWNFGSILGLILGIQILSGLLLSMHYSAGIDAAFDSVVHITLDVNGGHLLRYIHANGATLFFISLYLHISRGVFFKSFLKSPLTWMSGVTLYLLFMGVAFLGYVLPWGQMSFWGATVITNLISAVPYMGPTLVEWIWGGFSVGGPTLSRFYTLHFALPFMGAGVALVHLMLLHETGSSNPLGIWKHADKITFHPFFTVKDILGFVLILAALFFLSFKTPLLFMDADNFILANPMVTPPHIQPEWYFLFAYAILRSIPNKLGGVLGLVLSITILYLLPWLSKSSYYKSTAHYLWCGAFFFSFLLLTYLGAMPVEAPYPALSGVSAFLYFLSVGMIML